MKRLLTLALLFLLILSGPAWAGKVQFKEVEDLTTSGFYLSSCTVRDEKTTGLFKDNIIPNGVEKLMVSVKFNNFNTGAVQGKIFLLETNGAERELEVKGFDEPFIVTSSKNDGNVTISFYRKSNFQAKKQEMENEKRSKQ